MQFCVLGIQPFRLSPCLYCKTLSLPGASAYNDSLMEHALEQARLVPLPYIICGDLNQAVEAFAVWPSLLQTGHQHLGDLYSGLFGKEYPTTEFLPLIMRFSARNWRGKFRIS